MVEEDEKQDTYEKWNPRLRDWILFGFGIPGAFHELIIRAEPRPIALAFFGMMIGIPFAALADALVKMTNRGKE